MKFVPAVAYLLCLALPGSFITMHVTTISHFFYPFQSWGHRAEPAVGPERLPRGRHLRRLRPRRRLRLGGQRRRPRISHADRVRMNGAGRVFKPSLET